MARASKVHRHRQARCLLNKCARLLGGSRHLHQGRNRFHRRLRRPRRHPATSSPSKPHEGASASASTPTSPFEPATNTKNTAKPGGHCSPDRSCRAEHSCPPPLTLVPFVRKLATHYPSIPLPTKDFCTLRISIRITAFVIRNKARHLGPSIQCRVPASTLGGTSAREPRDCRSDDARRRRPAKATDSDETIVGVTLIVSN